MLPYQLVRPLGEGGFGDLWLGFDGATGQHIVVKFLRESHLADALRTFLREIRILRLGHAGVVPILHADLTGPRPYYVMPYLGGGPVSRHAGILSRGQLITVAAELATTIQRLHQTWVIHGDIKSDNVLIDNDGHLNLADPLGHGLGCTITFGHNRGGTPGFWAPEIAAGGSMSRPGDVYSYGATLYHLASGVRPVDGRRLALQPVPGVPNRVIHIVNACCDRDPQQRPTMAEVLRMLHGEHLQEIRAQKRNAWAAIGLLALVAGLSARGTG